MEESEECAVCGSTDDELLMLSCIHDPCIKCATRRYAQESQGRKKYLQSSLSQQYTCEICAQVTPLDSSAVIQLQKSMQPAFRKQTNPLSPSTILPKNSSSNNLNTFDKNQSILSAHLPPTARNPDNSLPKNRPDHNDYDYGYSKRPTVPENNRYRGPRPQSQQQIQQRAQTPVSPEYYMMPVQKTTRILCRQHQDQEVTYFCFKCMATICAECAIHGNHQGHEVRQIKKAVAEIKKNYLDFVEKLHRVSNMQKNLKQTHLISINEVSETAEKNKRAIIQLFEMLKKEIAKKEKQVLRDLDQMARSNITVVQTRIDKCVKQREQCEKYSKNILALMKKEDICIIEEFSKSHRELNIQRFSNPESQEQPIELRNINYNQARNIVHQLVDLVSKLQFGHNNVQLGESMKSLSLDLN